MSRVNPPDVPATVLPAAPRRRRWLSILLSLIVFLSGVVIGGGGALLVVRNQVLRAIHHPEQTPPRMAARLGRRLGLSPEQVQRVEEILRARQARVQAIRAEVQPRLEGELTGLEQEGAAVLDEAQKAQWHAGCAELRRTWLPALPVRSPGK